MIPLLKKLPVYRKFAALDANGNAKKQLVKITCPLKLQGLMANPFVLEQLFKNPDFVDRLSTAAPSAVLCEGSSCGAFVALDEKEFGCGFGMGVQITDALGTFLSDAMDPEGDGIGAEVAALSEEVESIRGILATVAGVAGAKLGINVAEEIAKMQPDQEETPEGEEGEAEDEEDEEDEEEEVEEATEGA